MKNLCLYLLILLPSICIGIVRTVALDGSQEYTSIQAAVDASYVYDEIKVYPGRYRENIIITGKRLTIYSLYAQQPQQAYMDSTIIDGNLGACIQVNSESVLSLNGFTLVNNELHENVDHIRGGGLGVDEHSTVSVLNCIIRDCYSEEGGGITTGVGANITLSNVNIYNNRADHMGGGICLCNSGSLTFDEQHPCSIYNNSASQGMDIYIGDPNPVNELSPVHVVLQKGSNILSEPDNYFITARNVAVSVSIQEAALPTIDSDLYVSPNGSDNNTGTSELAPLKTIVYAMQRVKSNPNTPRTLHIAAGLYSYADNEQLLPISLKSNVRIRGAGAEHTIIDGEIRRVFWGGCNTQNFQIQGMSLVNGNSYNEQPIELVECSKAKIEDIAISNSMGYLCCGLELISCKDLVLQNLTVGNVSSDHAIPSVFADYCQRIVINQLVTTDTHAIGPDADLVGIYASESDIVIRNSIFANNSGEDTSVFSYQTIYPEHASYNLEMSNILIVNNAVDAQAWVFAPIYIQNRFQPVKIQNCTFANNTGSDYLTRIFAYAEISNLISYNPNFYREIALRNSMPEFGILAPVTVRNSLFRLGWITSSVPELVTQSDNLMGRSPLFIGQTDSIHYNPSEASYYQLSAMSPCIDAGVADTTGLHLPAMDLAGNYRIWNNRVDIGSYEYGATPYVPLEDPTIPEPLNREITISTYPNPARVSLTKGNPIFIEFNIPSQYKQQPKVEIYNVKGQRVRELEVGQSYEECLRAAGLGKKEGENQKKFSIVWDGNNDQNETVGSGLYIIRVIAGSQTAVHKMMLLK